MWFTVKRRGYNEMFFFALSCGTEIGENGFHKWYQPHKAFLEDILVCALCVCSNLFFD